MMKSLGVYINNKQRIVFTAHVRSEGSCLDGLGWLGMYGFGRN